MRFFKLFIVTIAAGAFIAALALLPNNTCFKNAEKYTFFCGDGSKNCREISCGGNAALTRITLHDVCGECAFYSELDVDEFLKSTDGEIIFTEELSDSVNYYCRANLPYKVTLYGEEINLHICVKHTGVKVASPIIFGGY